jgi:hypothetical protein
LTSPALRARLREEDEAGGRARSLEALWDLVWRRRVAYFVTLGLTLLLVTMPAWVAKVPGPPLLGDGRTWIGSVIRLMEFFLPGFLAPWVDTYADNAFYFLLVAAAIGLVMAYSSACELKLRDRARDIWRNATTVGGEPTEAAPPTRLEQFRNATTYQRWMQRFKWQFLPNAVVAPLIALAGLWLLAGLTTQVWLTWMDSGGALCTPATTALPELTASRIDFSTRATCGTLGARVIEGQRYVVTLDVVDDWRDGPSAASPVGLAASEMRWPAGFLGVPFRRVVNARYLQPAIEIREAPRRWHLNNVYVYPLNATRQGDAGLVYTAEFEAAHDGELLLFANDAVLPGIPRFFYEETGGSTPGTQGNGGTACVTIIRADLKGQALGPPHSPVCETAFRRAAHSAPGASLSLR